MMEHSQIKRYYVGAEHIATAIGQGRNIDSCHMNLSSAIEEAKMKVARGSTETAIVVQIIRVVRRSTPPIEIIDIE